MLDSPAALASLIHIIGPASQDRSKMGKWAMMADARKALIEKPNPTDSDPVTVQLAGPQRDPAVNEEFVLDVVVSNTSSASLRPAESGDFVRSHKSAGARLG